MHTDYGTSIVPANRIAWTPAHIAHRHSAYGDTDMRIVFLPPTLARRIPDRPAVFLATGLARELLLVLTGDGVCGYNSAARTRLRRVLLDELGQEQEQPLHLPEPQDDRLRALARMLSDAPADSRSMAELGRKIGASSRTLSRLLHKEFGMTFYEWRGQLRIFHALLLLAAGHDITHTAYACGWSNPSSFIAAFTKIVGSTPGRYRADRPGEGRSP